ncbi:MAG: hypothetical protein J7K68_00445 [Candidatus Diapherotrites archaeon]|nr:hypothetical protein [Candidatus Diapherotrites archaeon]
MDIDFEMPETISERKKEIAVGVIIVVILVGLLWFISGFAQPKTLELSFTKPKIKANEVTTLVVNVRNTLGHDVTNATVEVIPESDSLIVPNNRHVEPTIGEGAYRRFEFTVMTKPELSKGTYKITARLEMDEKIEERNVYLEIT